MRVLQAMAGAEFGGAEAFFVRLVSALHAAGLDQKVVIRANDKRASVLRSAGIDPVQLKFGGRFDLSTPLLLKRELRSFRPDEAPPGGLGLCSGRAVGRVLQPQILSPLRSPCGQYPRHL